MLPVKSLKVCLSTPEEETELEDSTSCDPVGNHIITLRTFYDSLITYEKKMKEQIKLKIELDPVPSMPEYPKDYPTPEFLHQRRSKTMQPFVYNKQLPKERIDNLRSFAVRRILLQSGFQGDKIVVDSEELHVLSHIADEFLQSFIERMRYHKNSKVFTKSQDLYNPLETTLQEFGMNGVNGLSIYYFEEYIRMCEALHNGCKERLKKITSNKELAKFHEDENETLSSEVDEGEFDEDESDEGGYDDLRLLNFDFL